MDAAASTVIILIFVFSIFGAVTSKKEVVERPQKVYVTSSYPEEVHSQVNSLDVPSEVFSAGYVDGLNEMLRKFILSYGKSVEASDARSISDNIIKYSQQYDINPRLMAAIIARESRFNKFAVSSSGAQGLGQLLPKTSQGLGVSEPFDIEQNVYGTVRYMRSMLDRFSGQNKVPYAIASYFEGPNSVKGSGGFKTRSKSYIEDILKIYNKI